MPDTTLSSLFPGYPLHVAGQRVFLRPVTVSELPAVDRVMEGWRIMIVSGGTVIDPDALLDLQELLASAAGRDLAWVRSLDEAAFETLFCHVIAINQAELFDPPECKGGDTLTWAAIAQRLIQAGHPPTAVGDYTLAQVRTFLEAITAQEREAFANALVAASCSMADPKKVNEVAERIRRGKP